MSGVAVTAPSAPTLVIRGTPYPVLLPTLRDPRLHLAAVITSLQVLGQVAFDFRLSIAQILLSLGTAATLEFGIVLWTRRVFMWPASALITGNGVAFVLRVRGTEHGDWWSMRGWWIFVATAAVSLLSKYVIKVRGGHVFNPSNIGLVLCFLILGPGLVEPLEFWWGPMSAWMALALAIIVGGGLAILARLHLLVIAAAFWLAFAAGIGLLAATGHAMSASWHVGPITGAYFWWVLVTSPEILVFMFFMITDPKTTPSGTKARIAYAGSVGLLAALLIAPARTEFWSKVAVLGALAIVCAARPVLERLAPALRWQRRRAVLALVAAAGVAVYVPALVAAGISARSAQRLLPPVGRGSAVAEVTIAPSPGVESKLSPATAQQIARDVIAGLPAYDVRRARVWLTPGPDQSGPRILITLVGTVGHGRLTTPLDRTFQVSPTATRYAIVRSRRAVPNVAVATDLVLAGDRSAPQGTPLVVRLDLRNPTSTSTAADVQLRLSRAGGTGVDVARSTIEVPARRQVSKSFSVAPSQWFAPTGSYRIAAIANGHPVGAPLAVEVTRPKFVVPVFRDATRRAGLRTLMPPPACGRWAAGAAWGDVNGDGYLDLFVPNRAGPSQLWINDGRGHFRDEAALRGVARAGPSPTGASFVDYDNDGHPDLFVFGDGGNRLFHNHGTGRFVDVTARSGLELPAGNTTSAAWADYDGDGRLDVFVTDYGHCGEHGIDESFVYGTGHLFHDDGNGRFSDVTRLLGRGATIGAGFQAGWIDVDVDGRPDLYLGNDYVGPHPHGNRFWRNDGPGPGGWRFTDRSRAAGLDLRIGTMGIAVGDYNRDLRPDLALPDLKRNWLLRNRGNGSFGDVSAAAGVLGRPRSGTDAAAESRITWGAGFYDLNLDGWEDLYFAAGSMEQPVVSRNQLFVNLGDGDFANLSAPSRSDDPSASRGVAFADYDNDGRTDMYVVNQARTPLGRATPHLLRNMTPYRGHWLEVDTVGTVSNRDGCGARLIATVGRAQLMREVLCGSTSLSSWSSTRVHFGLRSSARVARLLVEWPSGIRQVLRNLPADRLLRVVEPPPAGPRPHR
jgi:FG-GAP-like repeat/ASPIC and UnbV